MGHTSFDIIRITLNLIKGIVFIKIKIKRIRFYALYKKGRFIRKINKVFTRIKLLYILNEMNINIIYFILRRTNNYNYTSLFTYLITFIKWVYTYNKKSDVFLTNQKIIKIIKIQYYRNIKFFKLNRNKEYNRFQMKELIDHFGILIEESTLYTLK